MPFIRSLASKYYTYIVALILSLGVVIPIYFYCAKKKLVCVIIIALSNHQPSFCSKYIKLNIRLSYNIKSVSNAEYMFLIYL